MCLKLGNYGYTFQFKTDVILNKTIPKMVKYFVPMPEIILIIQLKASPTDINIIQGYASTAYKLEPEIDKLYQSFAYYKKASNKYRYG